MLGRLKIYAKKARPVAVPVLAVAVVCSLGQMGLLAHDAVTNILCGIVAGIAAR